MYSFHMKPPETQIVVVGGAGHVGLPLCLVLAETGFQVIAFDTSVQNVNLVNSGVMPFMDAGAPQLLLDCISKGNFSATCDKNSIKDADIVIVVIGTPVDEYLSPNPNELVDLVEDLTSYMNQDQLLILRSTIFPGVSRKIMAKTSERFPGIKIAYCPERIIEGNAISELKSLPQIVGGIDETSSKAAAEIFEKLGSEIIYTSPEEAELAKIFTNVWRYIKFATANQFWMMSTELNIDFEKVRYALSHNYPRASDMPHAGFTAGPCLFKDTMQLGSLSHESFALGHSAMLINEGIPSYIVHKISQNYDISKLRIGILGSAFKAEIDDNRSSLAYKLRKLLLFKAKEVRMCDPFVIDSKLVGLDEVLSNSDLLIIGAPHKEYNDLEIGIPIIDIWGLSGRSVLI